MQFLLWSFLFFYVIPAIVTLFIGANQDRDEDDLILALIPGGNVAIPVVLVAYAVYVYSYSAIQFVSLNGLELLVTALAKCGSYLKWKPMQLFLEDIDKRISEI